MRLLVFGHTGQVARELARACPADWQMQTLNRTDADLSDPEACARMVQASTADVVINAAAYTAVDRAETEPELAQVINAEAPAAMAKAAADRGVPLIHLSTDYVFDGSGATARVPDAAVGPLGAYGRSKLAGEIAVRTAGGVSAILRTSWVFSAHGGNFVKTMLRLGAARDEISVVADQIGGPTPASAIAEAVLTIARRLHEGSAPGGTWHFSGAPDVSWADFARAILAQAGLACTVRDIATSAYPTPARRPANSRLDSTSFAATFGVARPDWRVGLAQVVRELRQAT